MPAQPSTARKDRATVTVPATSANVGVGFDCLGIALSLYARFEAERAEKLSITGCDPAFAGEDNLFYQSMRYALRAWSEPPFPIRLRIDTDVPLARGLGSSSTLVVGGICAAALLTGRDVDRAEVTALASALEGHPDNVAPAIWGSLVCSFTPEGEKAEGCDGDLEPALPEIVRYDVADNLRFVCVVPPYEVKTSEARRVVPQTVPLSTTVWQMGRIAGATRALETGDVELLARALDDRLHEPHRRALIPDYEAIRSICLEAGAVPWISGSGSTVVAAVAEKNVAFCPVAKRLADDIRGELPHLDVHVLACDTRGVRTD